MRMMQEPIRKPLTTELGQSGRKLSRFSGLRNQEQVFIRIDKFEAAIEIFSEIKRKIADIEANLEETRRIREKESLELEAWENEIRTMKDQIEKVDRDVFSKL